MVSTTTIEVDYFSAIMNNFVWVNCEIPNSDFGTILRQQPILLYSPYAEVPTVRATAAGWCHGQRSRSHRFPKPKHTLRMGIKCPNKEIFESSDTYVESLKAEKLEKANHSPGLSTPFLWLTLEVLCNENLVNIQSTYRTPVPRLKTTPALQKSTLVVPTLYLGMHHSQK